MIMIRNKPVKPLSAKANSCINWNVISSVSVYFSGASSRAAKSDHKFVLHIHGVTMFLRTERLFYFLFSLQILKRTVSLFFFK